MRQYYRHPQSPDFKGCISIIGGIIASITECENDSDQFILPGFVDAHVLSRALCLYRVNSPDWLWYMALWAPFRSRTRSRQRAGVQGVEFMIQNAQKVPLKIYFDTSFSSCYHF